MDRPRTFLYAIICSCCALALGVLVEGKQYCVCSNEKRSTDGATACRGECKQFEQYLHDNLSLDHSLFSFFPGTHNLTLPWNLTAGIQNLTLTGTDGDGRATIQCLTENAGLQFVNFKGLAVKSMDLSRCGMDAIIDEHKVKSALIFHNGEDLELARLNVSRYPVAGMSIHDVWGRVTITGSLFADASFLEYDKGNFIGFNNEGSASTVEISNTRFENNRYENSTHNLTDPRLSAGLSLILRVPGVTVSLCNVTLRGNSGYAGGNLAIIFFDAHALASGGTSVTVSGGSLIEGGSGNVGGGMFVTMVNSRDGGRWNMTSVVTSSIFSSEDSETLPLLTIRDTTFKHNTVDFVGGAIYLKMSETSSPASPQLCTVVMENCTFVGNSLGENGNGGAALHFTTYLTKGLERYTRPQIKVLVTSCSFSEHHRTRQMPPKLGDAVILVKTSSYFSLTDVNITSNNCTGLLAISSHMVMSGQVDISDNRAFRGGGILLCAGAVLYLGQHTSLLITGNEAQHTGGGIGVEMECVINKPQCFFQFDFGYKTNETQTTSVTVKDNSAGFAGSNIYGGSVSDCYLMGFGGRVDSVFREVFDTPRNDLSDEATRSLISSSPTRVCRFNQTTHKVNCSDAELETFPGQKFKITVVVMGQHRGLVPGTVHATLEGGEQYLGKGDSLQRVESTDPKELGYTIYSKQENVTTKLLLSVERQESGHSQRLEIAVKVKPCPLGYTLHNQSTQSRCGCDQLKHLVDSKDIRKSMKCFISKRVQVRYPPPLWIGLVRLHQENRSVHSIALSRACPHDYCNFSDPLSLNLMGLSVGSSSQCYFNRSGVLCGGCRANWSLILGSSECRADCTHYYLFLLPAFAVAGLVLVFLMTFLNLTVSAGTINGLIFYANVVQIYAFYMFEQNKASFLRIFLAWLNLDLGFRTCLFRGMDGLAKAMLQFAFPIYIWVIAGGIIMLSRRSALFGRLFGKNSVQVLATLVLMSYTKIIRAAMDAMHYTVLYLPPQGEKLYHWSLDGRLGYLQGRHRVVFVLGMVFALASFPFALTLLCIQQVGRIPVSWPVLGRIHRLKPFFDSYTGPCTDRGRFWTGLLLLVRIFILAVYSFDKANSSDILILAITVLFCFVLLFVAVTLPGGGVYSGRHGYWLNVLEYFFLVNLGLLFLAVLCSMHYKSRSIRVYVVRLSIGASFAVFLLVVAYHLLARLGYLGTLARLRSRLANLITRGGRGGGGNTIMASPLHFTHSEEREPLLINSSEQA